MNTRVKRTTVRTLCAGVVVAGLLLAVLAGCDIFTAPDDGGDGGGGGSATVAISPAGGVYYSGVQVTLSTDTGAPMVYSVDGSTPATPYEGAAIPLALPATGSTAITVRAQLQNGTGASTATYTLTRVGENQVQPASFWPPPGTYNQPQTVTIASATDGATLHYTTDGTDPTTSSAAYTASLAVNVTTTIKVLAVKAGMDHSPIATALYTADAGGLDPVQAQRPVFIAGGSVLQTGTNPDPFVNPIDLAMLSVNGAAVYYTYTISTDMDTAPAAPAAPTALNGSLYSGPLKLGRTGLAADGALERQRVRVRAVAAGYVPAEETMYTISEITDFEIRMDLALTVAVPPTITVEGETEPVTGDQSVPAGTTVYISRGTDPANQGLRVYYTTDGSDPRTLPRQEPLGSSVDVPIIGSSGETFRIRAYVGLDTNEYVTPSEEVDFTFTVE